MPINELLALSTEDVDARIRERIVEMYCRIGSPQEALDWLWKDVAAKQQGE